MRERSRKAHKPSQRPHCPALPWVVPDQDLVLQIPNLDKSFETSQADLGIGGERPGIAHGARGGQLCPDTGCGCQIPQRQVPGQTPSDEALPVGEQLAGEDAGTVPALTSPARGPGSESHDRGHAGVPPALPEHPPTPASPAGVQSALVPDPNVAVATRVHVVSRAAGGNGIDFLSLVEPVNLPAPPRDPLPDHGFIRNRRLGREESGCPSSTGDRLPGPLTEFLTVHPTS